MIVAQEEKAMPKIRSDVIVFFAFVVALAIMGVAAWIGYDHWWVLRYD